MERTHSHSEGKHPGSFLVRDFRSILEDPDIELVVVNTPDHLHTDMCSRAMRAGKHVVVEKPFTLKSSEADELIRVAGKRDASSPFFKTAGGTAIS
ncbi:MAG: Gfo/Idh/MocA family oxidoreductase [Bacteroidales bacterium]